MVFADPPYLLSNGGFTVHAGRRVSVNKGEWDKSNGLKKDFEFHLEWIQAVKTSIKTQSAHFGLVEHITQFINVVLHFRSQVFMYLMILHGLNQMLHQI